MVLGRHSEIDCLKVDTEGAERLIISSIEDRFWPRIKSIYAENCDSPSMIPQDFARSWRYNVELLRRRDA